MKRIAWIIAALLSVAVAIYASIFPVAEIFTEVVMLRTYDDDGASWETRLTVVDIDGTPWVSGWPCRGWFRRVAENPRAEHYRGGVWRSVEALVSPEAADAVVLHEVALETYGIAYQYVDLIARMSRNEVPVRLAAQAQ